VSRADVAGLDAVVQTLQVRPLKVRISTIGPDGSRSFRKGFISQPQNQNHLQKQIEQTTLHFHTLKKEIS
jgi:hypothetical protein